MAVDFKTFVDVVGFVTDVRKPVLLRGRHGIGKSTVVYQYADKVDMPVVERRASQMTEGDLVGLPIVDGECTRFNPPIGSRPRAISLLFFSSMKWTGQLLKYVRASSS